MSRVTRVKRKIKYVSDVTPEGNSSFSFLSREEADNRAAALDAKGCVNCIECIACVDCNNCFNCVNCADCDGCNGCTDCDYCLNCTNVLQLVGKARISRG